MTKPLFRYFLFIILFIGMTGAFAQGTSNKGKDFWVAYQGHLDNNLSRLNLFVTSNSNAVVNINAGGVALAPVNLIAGQAVAITIDPNVYKNTYIAGTDVIQNNAGIHITSNVDIIVYCHISYAARSASSLILPVKALGNEYYAVSYTQSSGTNRYSEFSLVGVEDSTIVEIKPVSNSIGNTKLANGIFRITLNKGDVYQYQSATDLTGTYIKTVGGCKPLAVFSGSTFSSFCEPGSTRSAGSGDPLYQQLFPTSAWGQNFVTAPFWNAQNGSADIIRIQVAKDNTIIKVNGSITSALGTPLSNPYVAGSVITYVAKIPTIINADQPISVAQIQVTQACNPNSAQFPGDPELTILNPIEQTLKDITVYSAISTASAPTNITKHYLNIILKTTDIPTLKVDGVSPTGTFITIDTVYSYITVDVTASSAANPAHRIVSNNGFIAIAYGYGNVESYAYLAGADLKNLNSNIELFPPGGTTQVSNLCLGSNYDIKLQLPYITSEIKWDFNNSQKVTTESNPTYTTITIGGKTYYIYKYSVSGSDITSPGNYNIKATVLNPAPTGCDANEDISNNFEVFSNPTADYKVSATSVCPNSLVTFTDASNGNGQNIIKWNWDFGDGSMETKTTVAAFTHLYASPGNYNVKLYVEAETGCISSVIQTAFIKVNNSPVAIFENSTLKCETQSISFIDKSTAIDGVINQWVWDFGDPTSTLNSSNLQSPSHTFAIAGTYNVNLTVTTDLGCTNTVIQQLVVNPVPVPDFLTPNICLDDASALFTNTTTIADNSALTYKWDFGDPTSANNTSTLKSPSHKYLAAKNYNVKLVVTSSSNCITEIIQVFTVNGSTPKAAFTIQNENILCSDQEVAFEDRSTIDFGEITRIDWYYDDATPTVVVTDNQPGKRPIIKGDTAKVYTHKYPTFYDTPERTVIVKMKAYSGNSAICTDITPYTIFLKAVPKADFSLPNSCLPGGDAQFTNASTYLGVATNMTYNWDFGDVNSSSNTSTNQDPIHHYTAAGNYKITLLTTSANGCTATSSKIFKVDAAIGNPKFSVGSNLCSNQKVLFTDLSTLSFGELNKVEWYFDNMNFPNDINYQLIDNAPASRNSTPRVYEFLYPKFSAPLTKRIEVSIKVFSGANCESEKTEWITLKAVPDVVFDPIPSVCEEIEPYMITQASEKSGFLGTGKYSGKGISSSGLFSPFSAGVGTHTITYTFTGDNGCEDIKSQDIIVNPTPTVDAGVDQIILIGGQAKLTGLASGKNITYKWTPSGYLDHDDIPNPIATPILDTKYTLTVTSEDGCTIMDDVFIKVLQFPIISNTFTPNGDGVNDTWSIKYLDSYANVSLKVYNRYGAEVFKADNYSTPWDGKQNGNPLPDGMYYYIISAKGGELKYSGSVMIVR